MVNGEAGSLGLYVQVLVRYDAGDLQDLVLLDVQPGHFQVHPHDVRVQARNVLVAAHSGS